MEYLKFFNTTSFYKSINLFGKENDLSVSTRQRQPLFTSIGRNNDTKWLSDKSVMTVEQSGESLVVIQPPLLILTVTV